MSLALEVGKTYRTTADAIVTIEHDKGDHQYPFFGVIVGSDGVRDRLAYFTAGGSYDVSRSSGFDIQTEVVFPVLVKTALKLELQSSDYRNRDYDVVGHPVLRRVRVPFDMRKGEYFNVYHGESSKSGAEWLGDLEQSLNAWLEKNSA